MVPGRTGRSYSRSYIIERGVCALHVIALKKREIYFEHSCLLFFHSRVESNIDSTGGVCQPSFAAIAPAGGRARGPLEIDGAG